MVKKSDIAGFRSLQPVMKQFCANIPVIIFRGKFIYFYAGEAFVLKFSAKLYQILQLVRLEVLSTNNRPYDA
ncbi:hypothetical protein ALP76_02211 [Pseudomonas savastanoi pv. glycinea]|uniref:Uncharacterized protein n=1 Tax=Pseudomonas savastanoi pv. glycinea TaxID=318 RepID=A0A3M3GC82_PSESG|nr:hypothetical protein [Pseudomonas savastanoi pv. phaseolicola]RMM71330.1 hypothetical protein ALQ73_01293 [Pseudomonas savastanoi pv. glycinea]RMR94118.1 hypothetical protein ALP76_02211 [Pseudomonas savastanoi pv. glycinea]